MSGVTVDVHRLVDGAALGAVRIDCDGRAVILLHDGLPVEEQAARLAELTRPGEVLVFTNLIPQPRSAVDDTVEARVS